MRSPPKIAKKIWTLNTKAPSQTAPTDENGLTETEGKTESSTPPSPPPHPLSIPMDTEWSEKICLDFSNSTEFRRATVLSSERPWPPLISRPAHDRFCDRLLALVPADPHCAPKVNQSESTSTAPLHKVALTHCSMY